MSTMIDVFDRLQDKIEAKNLLIDFTFDEMFIYINSLKDAIVLTNGLHDLRFATGLHIFILTQEFCKMYNSLRIEKKLKPVKMISYQDFVVINQKIGDMLVAEKSDKIKQTPAGIH